MGNGLATFHQSHCAGVIMVCNITLSELAQQNKVQVALGSQNYVVKFNCYAVREWNGDGANLFCLNDLADDCDEINTFGLSIVEEVSVVA